MSHCNQRGGIIAATLLCCVFATVSSAQCTTASTPTSTKASVVTYTGPANCQWSLTCAASGSILRLSISFQAAYQAQLTFTGGLSDTTATAVTMKASFTTTAVFRTGTVVDVQQGNGQPSTVNIEAQCLASGTSAMYNGCPANASVTLATGQTAVVGSDLDGDGAAKFLPGLSCRWFIACSDRSALVQITQLSGAITGDSQLFVSTVDGDRGARLVGNIDNGISSTSPPFGTTADILFVTAGQSERGFSLTATCVASGERVGFFGCPPSTFVTGLFPGVIGSDIDGSGPALPMTQTNCRWRIDCPANHVVKVTSTSGKLRETQQLRYRDAQSTRVAMTKSGSVPGVGAGGALLSQSALFELNTQGDTNEGFTLAYDCVPLGDENVHVGCPDKLVMAPAGSGYIASDLDGSGAYPMASSGACEWNITCPAGTQLTMDRLDLNLGTDDILTLLDRNTGRRTTVFSNRQGTVTKLDLGDGVFVRLQPATTAYDGRGFSANYSCKAAERTVRSGCPDRNDVVTAFPGRFQSDVDGDGATTYAAETTCVWHTRCPTGYAVRLQKFSAAVTNGDDLEFLDPDARSAPASTQRATEISVSDSGLISNEVILRLRTDSDNNVGRGFTFDYTCEVGTARLGCPDLANITAYPGQIGSDADGYGPICYSPSTCRWHIVCPDRKLLVLTGLRAGIGPGDVLEMTDVDSRGWVGGALRAATYNADKALVVGQGVRVRLNPNDETQQSPGFGFNYTCAPISTIGAYVRGLCPELDNITDFPGSIISDIDGVGAFPYEMRLQCRWVIKCPAAHVAYITYLQADVGEGDGLRFTERDTNRNTGRIVSRQMEAKDPFPVANTFGVYFSTDSGPVYSKGFTVNYTCLPLASNTTRDAAMGCPPRGDYGTGLNVTALEGRIGSDVDGSGPINYDSSSPCFWTIRCPDHLTIVATFDMRNLRTGDAISFTDPLNGRTFARTQYNSLQLPFPDLGTPLVLGNSTQISFQASEGQGGDGFTLDYKCSDKYTGAYGCPSERIFDIRDASALPIYIGTEVDGALEPTKRVTSATCSWLIRCPAGSYVYLRKLRAKGGGIFKVFGPKIISTPLTVSGDASILRDATPGTYTVTSVQDVTQDIDLNLDEVIPLGPSLRAEFRGTSGEGMHATFDCATLPGFGLGFTNVTVTDMKRGVLSTDPDGAGQVFYVDQNTKLAWTVTCPERHSVVFEAVALGFFWMANDISYVTVTQRYSAEAASITNPQEKQVIPDFLGVPQTRSVVVRYTSTQMNYGAHMKWACVPGVSGAGFPANGIVAGHPNITVASDIDGPGRIGAHAGPASAVSGKLATGRWNVVCPRNMAPQITSISSSAIESAKYSASMGLYLVPAATIAEMDAATEARVRALGGSPEALSHVEWAEEPEGVQRLLALDLARVAPFYFATNTGSSSAPKTSFPALAARAFVVVLNVTMGRTESSGQEKGLQGGFLIKALCACVDTPGKCPPVPLEPLTATATRAITATIDPPPTASRSLVPTLTRAVETTSAPPTTMTTAPSPVPTGTNVSETSASPVTSTTAPSSPPATTQPPTVALTPAPSTTTRAPPRTPKPTDPKPRERTHTLVPPTPEPTEVPPTPPPTVISKLPPGGAAVKTTTQATAAAAAMVNPAVAAQTARAGVVLELAACVVDLGDDLGFMEHPTQVSIGDDDVQHLAGAAAMNIVVIGGIILVHFLVAAGIAAHGKKTSPTASFRDRLSHAMGASRFPAATVMFITMLLLQPTITAAVLTIRFGTNAALSYAIGGVSLVCIALPSAAVTIYVARNFGSSYKELAPEPAAPNADAQSSAGATWLSDDARKRLQEALKRRRIRSAVITGGDRGKGDEVDGAVAVLWDFIDGTNGKWVDQEANPGFTKRFGLMFTMYDPKREWFITVELGLMAVCGVLDGFRSDQDWMCKLLVYLLCSVHVSYLCSLVLLRPYGTKFDTVTFIFLAASQLVAAACIALTMNDIGPKDALYQATEYATTVTMFVATGKAVADLLVQVVKLVIRVREHTISSRAHRKSKIADALGASSAGDVGAPLLSAVPVAASAGGHCLPAAVSTSQGRSTSQPRSDNDEPVGVVVNPLASVNAKDYRRVAASAPPPPPREDDEL
jgi:hypothetical protein